MSSIDSQLRALCKQLSTEHCTVHFLNKDSVDVKLGSDGLKSDIDGGVQHAAAVTVRIVGCTLWSHVVDDGEMISDYKAIHVPADTPTKATTEATRVVKAADTNALHDDHRQWLTQQIAEAERIGLSVVVLTHHKPYRHYVTAAAKQLEALRPTISSLRNLWSAFESDCTALIRPPVVCWAYGHTHLSAVEQINGVYLISNQAGYHSRHEHETINRLFRNDFHVRLQASTASDSPRGSVLVSVPSQ